MRGQTGTGSFAERIGRVEAELEGVEEHEGKKTIAERIAHCEHEAGIGE